MDTSSNASSSFGDAEGQPFVWDQNPDDASSDSSEDHPPAHAYLDEISGPINENITPSMISTGSSEPSMINNPLPRSPNSNQNSAAHGSPASFQGSVDMSLDSFRVDRILPPELTSHGHGAARSDFENTSINSSLQPLPHGSNISSASSAGLWSADMDLTSVIVPGQVPAPDTSGSVQDSEQSTRSVPRSPLFSQQSNTPSPTKSNKSNSYSGLAKASGAEARPSSRSSKSSGQRRSSRHSDKSDNRRRVSSPSWHGSEILASSGIAWKETQELREKLARSLALNDALQRDVKRLEQALQNEKDYAERQNKRVLDEAERASNRAEMAELAVKDERRLAREALEKAELKAQGDVRNVEERAIRELEKAEQRAIRELDKAEQRAIRAEAIAEQERKSGREAAEKVEVRVERAEARAERAETRAWQAVERAEINAKEREEYRIKALMAEAEVKDLKARLAQYERGRK